MLKDQITTDIKQAMKARDQVKLDTLRFLLAEIKNVEIDSGQLSDADIQKIIRRQIKQIDETLPQYRAAGRTEQVATDEAKKQVLVSYLPTQLSDADLTAIVTEVIGQTPNPSVGTIMPVVMQRVAGQAEGSRVAQIVSQTLTAS